MNNQTLALRGLRVERWKIDINRHVNYQCCVGRYESREKEHLVISGGGVREHFREWWPSSVAWKSKWAVQLGVPGAGTSKSEHREARRYVSCLENRG